MSLVSSFTLRPYASGNSHGSNSHGSNSHGSNSNNSNSGSNNGGSAFESYDSKSHAHDNPNDRQFLPIRIGKGIFAGTMLQDRTKRPASLRFELGGERPTLHQHQQHHLASQSLPEHDIEHEHDDDEEEDESESEQSHSLGTPNSKLELLHDPRQKQSLDLRRDDYKALHLQSVIRTHEQQRQIFGLQEEKRQLRLRLIDLQAKLLESQNAQQQLLQQHQQQHGMPIMEHPATPVKDSCNTRVDSKTLPNEDSEKDPPIQIVTHSIEHQQQQQQEEELDQFYTDEPVLLESGEKENVDPEAVAVVQEELPKRSHATPASSDDDTGITHYRKGLREVKPRKSGEPSDTTNNPPLTTRRSSRRNTSSNPGTRDSATTTKSMSTKTATPPDSPPQDGLVDAMLRSASRKSKRRQNTSTTTSHEGKSSLSPLLQQLNESCQSLSPILVNADEDEELEHHDLILAPTLDASVHDDDDDHDGVAVANTTRIVDRVPSSMSVAVAASEQPIITEAVLHFDEPPRRPKRSRRNPTVLLPNSFQAPALKKKKTKAVGKQKRSDL